MKKKIGVNETASSESVFKMGYLGHFWATFWTWNGSKSVEIETQSSLTLIFLCMMKPMSSFLAYYQLRILVFSICGTVFPKKRIWKVKYEFAQAYVCGLFTAELGIDCLCTYNTNRWSATRLVNSPIAYKYFLPYRSFPGSKAQHSLEKYAEIIELGR